MNKEKNGVKEKSGENERAVVNLAADQKKECVQGLNIVRNSLIKSGYKNESPEVKRIDALIKDHSN